ncbi:glycogen biosynthesis protein GlgD [Niallia sp.]|uniref:glycogen biosynthesis protein GlgD n=1 Tax=Niallia sp. TaxID=2837523 RepID=UPI002897F7A8|nr:glycogen biosynthesis protein GlgD [Niallia sp.]
MDKRSKKNNPEQKTRNGINSQDLELGKDVDLVKAAKKKYEQSGGQPAKSKTRQE